MKVRVIYNYYDRELGVEKKVGDEIEVSEERGRTLIAAEVAEEIIEVEESSEEVEEAPEAEETSKEPKPKKASNAKK